MQLINQLISQINSTKWPLLVNPTLSTGLFTLTGIGIDDCAHHQYSTVNDGVGKGGPV